MRGLVSVNIGAPRQKPDPLLSKIALENNDLGYRLIMNGNIWYRKIVRDDKYEIDYSSDGGISWELGIARLEADEDTILIGIDDNPAGYRDLVRNGSYVIDSIITLTGFSGIRNKDWEEIVNIKG